jgi:hypothetical protein
MKRNQLLAWPILAVLALLATARGAEAKSASFPAEMAGAWSGVGRNGWAPGGGDAALGWTLDAQGNFTGLTAGGAPVALTGKLLRQAGNVFGVKLSDETKGYIFFDPTFNHAFYVDHHGTLAVVEKNAGKLPAYRAEDLHSVWTGTEFRISEDFEFDGFFCTAVDIREEGTGLVFSGRNSLGPVRGVFGRIEDPEPFGHFGATCICPQGKSLLMDFFLSPDKNFALGMTHAPDPEGVFPGGATFTIWMRL